MPTQHKKNLTSMDDYTFELSKELEKLASEELRETEEMRQHALKALREWILKNERIVLTRMDANFLLRFLRFRKFSLPMAMEAIERLLVIKSGGYGKGWMSQLSLEKPSVMKLFEKGFMFFLPERDYMGRLIIFYRPGVSDSKSPTVGYDVLILTTMIFNLLLEDEENQIKGVIHLADASNLRMSHFTVFSPQFMFRIGKNTEKTLPIRHKAFHMVNVHKSISWFSNAALSAMSEKLRKRVHFYSSFKELGAIERSKLPKEYGGTIPMSQMIESTKQFIMQNKKNVELFNQMRVNIEKYPRAVSDGSVKSLKYSLSSTEIYEKFNDEFYGVQGSFRKLEID